MSLPHPRDVLLECDSRNGVWFGRDELIEALRESLRLYDELFARHVDLEMAAVKQYVQLKPHPLYDMD